MPGSQGQTAQMNKLTKHITTILSLVLAVVLVGCSQGTTAQGTLYSVSASRRVEAYLPQDLETVHKAAAAAVKDLGYTTDNEAIDVREGIIEGHTARDRTMRIETFKEGDEITRIKIYVGGDELASREVLHKIESAVK